ncbi:MAG TPA: hypothetical protein VFL62_10650 [Bradyrhizobium sp.]|uniref:hypothetical protein n=1 Tax=Bradyrhizobium sp. TaxID=376 RepID=UPI002D7E3E66|nr:hypothetical protein [Bradyrhizobium sp.]HET7886676.1 hypothetical protein [Bradyrhizobium sp.]
MIKRRRFKQTISLKDRLTAFAEEARRKAKMVVGGGRDELVKKARHADTAAHIEDWVNSPGLQPPK